VAAIESEQGFSLRSEHVLTPWLLASSYLSVVP